MIRNIGTVSIDTRGDMEPHDIDGNGRYQQ